MPGNEGLYKTCSDHMGTDLASDAFRSGSSRLHTLLHRIMDCQILPSGSNSDIALGSRLAVLRDLRGGMDSQRSTLAVETLS